MFWPVGRAGQQREQRRHVLELFDDLLDAGDGDMHRRRRGAMRPLPSFSTRHSVPVSATAKLTPERPMSASNFSQHLAADLDQRIDVVGVIDARHVLGEQAGDLLLGLVDGRHDDVRRLFASQLDDVFAHVRFQRTDAGRFGGVVQLDFLADHRLALDHQLVSASGRCRG